jgi:hypothetical protein
MSTGKLEQELDSSGSKDRFWSFWPLLPLYPYGNRRTLRQEVINDTIWTFDQLMGILYVVVPIRMTVVRLEAGGLLIYGTVAPTKECIRLVRDLAAKYGEVKYIIHPTISGLEHKIFVGPFARNFPTAQVFVAPSQWSFPLSLPLSWLGLPAQRTQVLPPDSRQTPFADEFDYRILGPINLGLGIFGEVAFFHRRSHSLLVTDLVISIPANPPLINQLDPYPLLFHAKDSALDVVIDSQENRRKGWQRIVLFALYFQPSALETIDWGKVWQDAIKASDHSKKAYFGLYPFQWQLDWQNSFAALQPGQLLVAPVLQTLILNRAPNETLEWLDWVTQWDFERIVSCHFDSPIACNRQQFRRAFAFLYSEGKQSQSLLTEDFQLLKKLDRQLSQRGIIPPPSNLNGVYDR